MRLNMSLLVALVVALTISQVHANDPSTGHIAVHEAYLRPSHFAGRQEVVVVTKNVGPAPVRLARGWLDFVDSDGYSIGQAEKAPVPPHRHALYSYWPVGAIWEAVYLAPISFDSVRVHLAWNTLHGDLESYTTILTLAQDER